MCGCLVRWISGVMRRKILVCVVLLVMLPFGLYAQSERESRDNIWVGIPLSISGQIPVSGFIDGQWFESTSEVELNLSTQVMFPLGNVVSIGPEVGLSYPLRLIDESVRNNTTGNLLDVIRLPIRLVLDVTVSESGLFHIQFLGGARFNFWNQDGVNGLKTLTFDIAGRVEIAGVFFEATYVPPYSVDLDPSASSKVRADTLGIWDDSVQFAAGYLFRI